MTLPSGFFNAILDREVAIGRTVTGIVTAGKHMVTSPGNNPFPQIICFFTRIVPSSESFDYIKYDVDVTIRVLAGSVSAGAIGQNEDVLNDLYVEVLNTWFARPDMRDPNEPKQILDNLLAGDQSAMIVNANGTVIFNYGDPAKPEKFFGTDFIHRLKLEVRR